MYTLLDNLDAWWLAHDYVIAGILGLGLLVFGVIVVYGMAYESGFKQGAMREKCRIINLLRSCVTDKRISPEAMDI